jgi:Prolyl oligopeptidase family
VTTVAAIGCARPPIRATPLVAAAPPDPSLETRDASLASGFITVTLRFRSGRSGPRPAIITPVTDEEWLLEQGFVLVTYREHWERLPKPAKAPAAAGPPRKTYGKWLLVAPTPDLVGRGYFAFIKYSATEAIPKILDYLATVPEVDPQRIGISGHSTTGFVALHALATDPRLRAAAVVGTCGDLHTFLRDSSVALNREVPLALDPTYDAQLMELEPIQHPERLTHAALLMINGHDDDAVPYGCVETTVEVLRPVYRRRARGRFRAIGLPGVGHSIPPAVATAMRPWWTRWLLRGSPAAKRHRPRG